MSKRPPYRILFAAAALRQFRKLPAQIKRRLAPAIEALATNPRPPAVVKLKGQQTDYYRIRVGDYRIIYEVQDIGLVVLVVKLADRRDVDDR